MTCFTGLCLKTVGRRYEHLLRSWEAVASQACFSSGLTCLHKPANNLTYMPHTNCMLHNHTEETCTAKLVPEVWVLLQRHLEELHVKS